MNIAYASDDKFAHILGISLISFLENNQSEEEIRIYVLDDNISENNKMKIKTIADKYRAYIAFIDVSNINVADNVISSRWSKSAFTRLYLKKLLPHDIEKILYLDCDTLILKPIRTLYDTDISVYTLAGVEDCISKYYKRNLGLADDDIYINSGVLLINLKCWDSNRMLNYLERYQNAIRYPDQDVINGTFSKEIKILPFAANSYTAAFDFTYDNMMIFRKPTRYYSREEVLSAIDNPVIVHFTSSFLSLRPWVMNCKHPFVNEWIKYKNMSPWSEEKLKKDFRSIKKRYLLKCIHSYHYFYQLELLDFFIQL